MSPDPLVQFENWYEEAHAMLGEDADVAALATATRHGQPSVRMVLYRGIREGGVSFFTNYESRKGQELTENPFAAMAMYWARLGRQVRIEGPVERLSKEESDRYFSSRPSESQISAIVSPQSRPLLDENEFIKRCETCNPGGRPANWGGYKLIPDRFEFWTRGEHRRHHRLAFEKIGTTWQSFRLYP